MARLPGKPYRTYVLLGTLCAALCFVLPANTMADDCQKAKQEYERGRQLVNPEKSRDAFQKAVKLCPTLAEAHYHLAYALESLVEKNNDYDTVIKHYKEAVKLNPNLSEAYVRLGANYLSIGLGERAVEVLKKAQELQPRDPKVRKLLKNAEQGISSDTRVLMKSDEIKNRLLAQTKDDGIKTMGPEPYTVAKGRLKFSNILFNEWSYQLHRPEAVAQVMELGAALASKDLSGYSFVIEGHTDNRGDPARNWQLSLDRANAVAQYLAAQFGLDPRRIVIQGYGFSRPRFENDTEEHMLLNRRVEVVVFQGTGQQ